MPIQRGRARAKSPLIDPAAPDLNFSIIGDNPYLYYVRLDNNGIDRVVFRQPLTLSPAQ